MTRNARAHRDGACSQVPVFEFDYGWFGHPEEPYPHVWITVPIMSKSGRYLGRERIAIYPIDSAFEDPNREDLRSMSETYCWYIKASEPSSEGAPVHWGSAALRLGTCYEEGFGCEQSFEKALDWYERARVGLQIVVNEGCPWYERPLDHALSGVLCCRQQLLGKY